LLLLEFEERYIVLLGCWEDKESNDGKSDAGRKLLEEKEEEEEVEEEEDDDDDNDDEGWKEDEDFKVERSGDESEEYLIKKSVISFDKLSI